MTEQEAEEAMARELCARDCPLAACAEKGGCPCPEWVAYRRQARARLRRMNGSQAIEAEDAARLAAWYRTSARFWTGLQASHEGEAE